MADGRDWLELGLPDGETTGGHGRSCFMQSGFGWNVVVGGGFIAYIVGESLTLAREA